MPKLLKQKVLFLFLFLGATSIAQICPQYVAPVSCSGCVSVVQTLYGAPGVLANGSFTISWATPFTAPDGNLVSPGCEQYNIINGVVNIAFEPNVGATPTGTYYTVQYNINGSGLRTQEFWVIPGSGPVNIGAVRTVPAPTPSFVISYLQIGAGSATTGQCLVFTSPSWGPGSCPGGGINQLTGDATAGPGSGSQAVTLSTVNSNVGTFGDSTHVGQFTVNGKGLITAASNVSISGGGGGASNSTQLTDCLWTRTSATVLTMTVGCYIQLNGVVYVLAGGSTITNSAGIGLTVRIYATDGSDGVSAGSIVVANSASSGIAVSAGLVAVNNISAFPQGQGGMFPIASWTAMGTPGQWDVSGYTEERAVYGGGSNIKAGTGCSSFSYAASGITINCPGTGGGGGTITETRTFYVGRDNPGTYQGQGTNCNNNSSGGVTVNDIPFIQFANTSTPYCVIATSLPAAWTSTVNVAVLWNQTSGGSGNVQWTISTRCVTPGTGDYSSTSYNTPTVVTTATLSANIAASSQATAINTGSCAAGDDFEVKVQRANGAGDTYANGINYHGTRIILQHN